MVGRKTTSVFLQFPSRRLAWLGQGKHPRFPGQLMALGQITRRTGGDHVGPQRRTATGPGNDVIEGQIFRRESMAAILAREPVTQENIEAGEGRPLGHGDVIFQRNYAGQGHCQTGRVDRLIIFIDNINAGQKYRLDGVLPGPKRQREVAQRPEIGVKNQSWIAFECHRHLLSSLLADLTILHVVFYANYKSGSRTMG